MEYSAIRNLKVGQVVDLPLLLVAAVVCGPLCVSRESCGQVESPPEIEVKQFVAVNLAYKKHSGPDWGLGHLYTAIGATIADEASAGPMFTRYVNSTSVDGVVAAARIEVGFLDRGLVRLPDGFGRKTLPACEAATVVVGGPYGLSHLHRRRVLDWIAARGYQAGGYVLEVYRRSESGEGPVVEIRVPIERVAAVSALADDVREVDSLKDLLSTREYGRAATVLFRATGDIPAVQRKWVGEVADRLRVLRSIVRAKYAGRGDKLRELITPFMDRAEVIGSEEAANAAGPDHGNRHPGSYRAALGSSTLRRIDRLVVKAYLKSSSTDDIHAELLEILLSAGGVINSTGPPPTPNIEEGSEARRH